MFRSFLAIALSVFALNAFAKTEALVTVKLSPAGGFEGKSASVQGFATKTGDEVSAKNVIVPLKTLKTGIELRDKHMLEKYMDVEKHPNAEIISATGKGGKGTGLLSIKGIQKQVSGTYTIEGNELTAEFPVSLKDFKIEGIRYMGVGVKDEVTVKVTLPLKASK